MLSRISRIVIGPVFVALVAATLACSSPAPDSQAPDLKTLKGIVRADGSSTVYPLAEAVAEEFNKVARGVKVSVGRSGTGGGFKRFAVGEIDISNASRPIKKPEMDTAKKNGIEFIELPLCYDGLSIVVNPKNTWVKSMTVADLKKIFAAASAAKTWKDVNPAWPEKTIKIYSPGTDSGTFDYFKEVVVGKDGSMRTDMSVSEDDNVLVNGVAGDESALGFFGCSYYFENKDKLKAVAIDDGKGAVLPTPQTIEDGSYAPFSRPLFIYVNRKSADKPEVQAFVKFFLEHAGKLADEVKYVHLPAELYSRATKNWADRRIGTQFSNEAGEAKSGSLAQVYQ